jgi:hypothetical protein
LEVDVGLFARLDVRRLTVFGLLALTCALLFVGLTDMGLCMPAMHAALTLATALGTWWLARDDFALNGSGAVGRLVLTGVCLGLGLTWAGATVAALLAVAAGEQWTQGEFAQALRHFMDDAAWHWTPLGLVAAFLGTGLSIILDQIGGSSSGRDERA